MTEYADPSQPLDLAQLRAAQAEKAAEPAAPRKETLNIGGLSLPLVRVLTPIDMIDLQEAQDSGSLRQIIEAIPRLVPKQYREQLLTFLLSDPDDDSERLDFNDVVEEFGKALEVITARP